MREESHDLLSRFLSLFDEDDDFYDERRNFACGEECCSFFCDV